MLDLQMPLEEFLDQVIASDSQPVPFTDARLLVPGFPGEPVYFLRDPVTQCFLSQYATNEQRAWVGTKLWSRLGQSGPHSRLRAHVALNLAQHVEPKLVEDIARYLAESIRADEIHDLTERVVREIHQGRLRIEAVWNAATTPEREPERQFALLSACEISGMLPPVLLGELFLLKGKKLNALREIAEAKDSFERALQPLREKYGGVSLPVANCLLELARLYTNLWVTEAAIGCVDEAVRLYEQVDPSYSGLGQALNAMALSYSLTTHLQNLNTALEAHRRAYEILKAEGRSSEFFAAIHLKSIGELLMVQGKNQTAIEHLERAAPLLEATSQVNPVFIRGCYENLAHLYSNQGMIEKAEAAKARAEEFPKQ